MQAVSWTLASQKMYELVCSSIVESLRGGYALRSATVLRRMPTIVFRTKLLLPEILSCDEARPETPQKLGEKL